MIDGEQKRRERALRFIEEFEKLLEPIATDIWGTGEYDFFDNLIQLTKYNKNNQKENTKIFFRYDGNPFGFCHNQYGIPDKLTWVCDLKGKDFWYTIQVIINWIPILNDMIEKRNQSREELLQKINF
jgi:hypothetical protein